MQPYKHVIGVSISNKRFRFIVFAVEVFCARSTLDACSRRFQTRRIMVKTFERRKIIDDEWRMATVPVIPISIRYVLGAAYRVL